VPKLQKLRDPLDVGEPAGAELRMQDAIRAARQALRLHACLEPSDLADLGVRRTGLRVSQGVDGGDEPRAELAVAGYRSRTQQRLRLPSVGPAPVVRDVGGERAYQRTLPALGPQVGVDQQRRVGTRCLEKGTHFGGDGERG
jgi:hypothetical protein